MLNQEPDRPAGQRGSTNNSNTKKEAAEVLSSSKKKEKKKDRFCFCGAKIEAAMGESSECARHI